MPRALPTPCPAPGCRSVTPPGERCDRHQGQNRNENRPTAPERGYDSNWRKVRAVKLRRDPLCERCRADSRICRASVVHHIDEDPSNNAPQNLESLCRDHHEIHHGRKRPDAAWWA